MPLALFGIKEPVIRDEGYRWVQWDYLMAENMARKFKNKKFKLYTHSSGQDFLLILSCSDLEYDVDGMECPEPEKACTDYSENRQKYENDGWVWRVWTKIENVEVTNYSYKDLKKPNGTPINPSGAQRNFIYVEELDFS
ncbi:MAG TPA: hypothetical protein ENH40_00060 [Nitrospirae bacterium]|nr:hypothetical protein [Nitrospirota bacterium]